MESQRLTNALEITELGKSKAIEETHQFLSCIRLNRKRTFMPSPNGHAGCNASAICDESKECRKPIKSELS